MSVKPNETPAPGGSPTNPPVADPANAPSPKPDTVSFESYSKLLDEKKKAQAKLDAFEAKEKEAKDAKLKENNDWKSLLETRETELATTKATLNALKEKDAKQAKVAAVLARLSGKIDPEYQVLIPLDSVTVNPETGMVDDASAEKVAKDFEAKHSRVIVKGYGRGPGHEAPRSNGISNLTLEEWKKLPAKEMKARYHEVYKAKE